MSKADRPVEPRGEQTAMRLQLKICRDDWGTWSVRGLSPLTVSHLPTLPASIDFARNKCGAVPATIEFLIDGFYISVEQERGWPCRFTAPRADLARQAAPETDLAGPSTWSRFLAWLKPLTVATSWNVAHRKLG
jgi:hypothetical protein